MLFGNCPDQASQHLPATHSPLQHSHLEGQSAILPSQAAQVWWLLCQDLKGTLTRYLGFTHICTHFALVHFVLYKVQGNV